MRMYRMREAIRLIISIYILHFFFFNFIIHSWHDTPQWIGHDNENKSTIARNETFCLFLPIKLIALLMLTMLLIDIVFDRLAKSPNRHGCANVERWRHAQNNDKWVDLAIGKHGQKNMSNFIIVASLN